MKIEKVLKDFDLKIEDELEPEQVVTKLVRLVETTDIVDVPKDKEVTSQEINEELVYAMRDHFNGYADLYGRSIILTLDSGEVFILLIEKVRNSQKLTLC